MTANRSCLAVLLLLAAFWLALTANIADEAKRRGKWVHMGRVNSLRRMRYAESIGCDSADGTVLKHDPTRPVASWGAFVRANPSLWRPA